MAAKELIKDFYQKNKVLGMLSIASMAQVICGIILAGLSVKFASDFSALKTSVGATSSNHSFMDFVYESGKASHIQQKLLKVSGSTYESDSKTLIKNYLDNLVLRSTTDTSPTPSSSNSGNFSSIKAAFQTMNVIIQVSSFFYAINWCLFFAGMCYLGWLVYCAVRKNRLYDLVKSLGCCVFNVFGFYFFAYFEKNIMKNLNFNFDKKLYSNSWKWVQMLKSMQKHKKTWLKIDDSPIVSVKNLFFSYEIKHNNLKHYWECIKEFRKKGKLNEINHLFSFKSLFQKNAPVKYLLKNINLKIQPNSFNVIVGPNGSGKSTLIKLLVNILPDHLNCVKWFNKPVSDIDKKIFYQKIAYLPQEIHIPDLVNIYDFLSFSRLPYSGFKNNLSQQDHLAILKAIKESGCYEFNKNNINELSGGQKQKVLIASILAKESDVIVLDEPTSFFDLKNQFKLLSFLKKLQESGKTIIIILHDLEQAINHATNLIVLYKNRVYAQGEPREVVTNKLLSDVFNIDCDIDFNDKWSTLKNITPIIRKKKHETITDRTLSTKLKLQK